MPQMRVVKGVKTKVEHQGKRTIVTYRGTPVVTFNLEIVLLNHGGWKTATTKTRMNQASNQFCLGYHVFQKNHVWYVTYKDETVEYGNFERSSDLHVLERNLAVRR